MRISTYGSRVTWSALFAPGRKPFMCWVVCPWHAVRMTARPEVHIVMIDPGDAAGMPTFARPVRAFIHIEVAEEFAAKAKERPEDAEFWIPPAAVTIETVEID